MRTVWQDLRYGARILRKSPGLTAAAILTLALGIGATTAIFSVIEGVLLRPLPFAEPERIVGLRETLPDEGSIPIAYRTFTAWREQNTVFEEIAALHSSEVNLEGDDPQRVASASVTPSYFAVMGTQPILGRAFLPEDALPGSERVVVLSYELWQSRFGGDRNLIGQQARIDGASFTVVGVMPPALPDASIGWASLWVPWRVRDHERSLLNPFRYLSANARLKPGVSVEQARAELERIMGTLKQEFPRTHGKPYGVDVRRLMNFVVPAGAQTALYVLAGAVLCVLLIACANVANLLLARAATRERELAVRTALGASRARIVRQLLAESLLLSLIGAGLGLWLAYLSVDALAALYADALPRFAEVSVNVKVLIFTLALSVITALAFGLAPALRATKFDVNAALKDVARGGVTASARRNRLRSALVISEIALSLVLLIAAGLLIKSFARLRAVEPGFNLDNVLTMEVNLPWATYPQPQQRVNFYRQTLERISSLPGVESASATQSVPFRPASGTDAVYIEGQPPAPPGQEPFIRGTAITSEYFQTMEIRLISGRPFTEQEAWETGGAIIVNQAFARRFFPGQDPVGRRMRLRTDMPWLTVVGVVEDTTQNALELQPIEEMYYTYANSYEPPVVRMNFAVRAAGDPAALIGAIREEIRQSDARLPVAKIATMRQLADRAMTGARFNLLLTLFAVVAFILALIGIYGVMSYTTAQRTQEIGIRIALGAEPRDILRLVVGQGLWLAAIGVATGIVAALLLMRVMASLLFGVSATDPVTFAGVALLLAGVALLASYIPARRAMKVDPMEALRYE